MEWIYSSPGKVVVSEGALFECPHCPGKALYWIGWWPHCSAGHDVRKPVPLLEYENKSDAKTNRQTL